MKRILALMRRDWLAATRDQMMLYVLMAPLLLVAFTRFLLPATQDPVPVVVVSQAMPAPVVSNLDRYFKVQVLQSPGDVETRVNAYDDVIGIEPDGSGYRVVAQGNEPPDLVSLPALVLQRIATGDSGPATVMADIGKRTPYREMTAAVLAIAVFTLAGILMGLLIIEDKESLMMEALGASPLSRREYLAARALMALVTTVALVFGTLWVYGVTDFPYLQVLAVALIAGVMSAEIGFLIGAVSANQIAGLAIIKFLSLAVMGPALAAVLVAEKYLIFLAWTPAYWPLAAMRTILEGGATWGALAPKLLWSGVTAVAYAGVFYPWLKGRLDFARN